MELTQRKGNKKKVRERRQETVQKRGKIRDDLKEIEKLFARRNNVHFNLTFEFEPFLHHRWNNIPPF